MEQGWKTNIENPIKEKYYEMQHGIETIAGNAAKYFRAVGWMNREKISRPPAAAPGTCNGLVEACVLPFDQMTFVNARK